MRTGDSICDLADGSKVSGFARVINKRVIGKIAFFDVRCLGDHIQLVIRKGIDNFSELVAITRGSLLYITGEKIITRNGTPSIRITQADIIHHYDGNMPEKYHGLSMVSRYKNRVDYMLTSEDAFLFTRKMSRVLCIMRKVLAKHDFQEFLTGVLQDTFEAGQSNPFSTHCNARNKKMNLSLTSELKLKRLLVIGFQSVYEIGQSFRNEGIDSIHSPEFTMLEAYSVGADCALMMELLEEMLAEIVIDCENSSDVNVYNEKGEVKSIVSYDPPFRRLSFEEAFRNFVGDLEMCDITVLSQKHPDMFHSSMTKFTWLMKVIEKIIVPNIHDPTFLIDLPSGMSPFVKKKKDNPQVSERAFLISQGLFLADIYSDENDLPTLMNALKHQAQEAGNSLNSEYLKVMQYGLPNSAGIGLGVNRLLMILLGKLPQNIKETILYPII